LPRVRLLEGVVGKPVGIESPLRHYEMPWELGEFRRSLFHFMVLNRDLNASLPPTPRKQMPTDDRIHRTNTCPRYRQTVARISDKSRYRRLAGGLLCK
jgi:hypothetical protein